MQQATIKFIVRTIKQGETYFDYVETQGSGAGEGNGIPDDAVPFATVTGQGYEEAYYMLDGQVVVLDHASGVTQAYDKTREDQLAELVRLFNVTKK